MVRTRLKHDGNRLRHRECCCTCLKCCDVSNVDEVSAITNGITTSTGFSFTFEDVDRGDEFFCCHVMNKEWSIPLWEADPACEFTELDDPGISGFKQYLLCGWTDVTGTYYDYVYFLGYFQYDPVGNTLYFFLVVTYHTLISTGPDTYTCAQHVVYQSVDLIGESLAFVGGCPDTCEPAGEGEIEPENCITLVTDGTPFTLTKFSDDGGEDAGDTCEGSDTHLLHCNFPASIVGNFFDMGTEEEPCTPHTTTSDTTTSETTTTEPPGDCGTSCVNEWDGEAWNNVDPCETVFTDYADNEVPCDCTPGILQGSSQPGYFPGFQEYGSCYVSCSQAGCRMLIHFTDEPFETCTLIDYGDCDVNSLPCGPCEWFHDGAWRSAGYLFSDAPCVMEIGFTDFVAGRCTDTTSAP